MEGSAIPGLKSETGGTRHPAARVGHPRRQRERGNDKDKAGPSPRLKYGYGTRMTDLCGCANGYGQDDSRWWVSGAATGAEEEAEEAAAFFLWQYGGGLRGDAFLGVECCLDAGVEA